MRQQTRVSTKLNPWGISFCIFNKHLCWDKIWYGKNSLKHRTYLFIQNILIDSTDRSTVSNHKTTFLDLFLEFSWVIPAYFCYTSNEFNYIYLYLFVILKILCARTTIFTDKESSKYLFVQIIQIDSTKPSKVANNKSMFLLLFLEFFREVL